MKRAWPWLIAGVGIWVGLLVLLPLLPALKWGGIRFGFDAFDLSIYSQRATFVSGDGVLYRDVFSEYPVLANLLFGLIRLVADMFEPIVRWVLPAEASVLAHLWSFIWIWLGTATLLFLFMVRTAYELRPGNLSFFLTPGAVYFALYRFDLFPAAASFVACLYLYRERYVPAMIWLGICIALKGYAMIMLPPLVLYLWRRESLIHALRMTALALAPFALLNVGVLLLLGPQELLQPYLAQAGRGLNGESLYDALSYLGALFGGDGTRIKAFFTGIHIAPLLAVGVLLAVIPRLRPTTPSGLIAAMLFCLGWFLAFTGFYSPQFLLWLLPLVCFAESRRLRLWIVVLGWASYLYFPVAFDVGSPLFPLFVILLSGLRLWLLVLTYRACREMPANENSRPSLSHQGAD